MSSPLVRWGTGFSRHGDHLRAKKYFTEAVEANPRDAEALFGLIVADSILGHDESAQQTADALVSLRPDSEEAAFVAAHMRLRRGDLRGGWAQNIQIKYRHDQRARDGGAALRWPVP